MKVTKDYDYMLTDGLYRLCNRKQYFTCGDCEQYTRMFDMSRNPDFSTRDLAIFIFACSYGKSLAEILEDVDNIYTDIQIRMYEDEQEEKERIAAELKELEWIEYGNYY